jgi:hypothetical protein
MDGRVTLKPTKTLSSHALTLLTDTVFARINLLAGWREGTDDPKTLSSHGLAFLQDGEKGPPPRTRTGRSRLDHRHGWLDAGWQGAVWREGTAGHGRPSVPVAKDSNRTFEVSSAAKDGKAPYGEKGRDENKAVLPLYFLLDISDSHTAARNHR